MISTTLVSDPDFPNLKDHLIQATGLAYYADKDEDLAERINRRLSALGLAGCGAYLGVLCDRQKGEPELDALIAELTIGETYFFRHREQFDALLREAVPDILDRNHSMRRLRIWCAGCATGAEPYSVAVLLKRELGHRVAGWDVAIVGTDVNREFLARAAEGRFEEWAFRAAPHLKEQCFRQQGKSWIIAPEYKDWVSFQYHNLVKHPFPSLVNNLLAFDLILCRNVMIYFHRQVSRSIVAQFQECLVQGGWLVVGHAEHDPEIFRSLRTVNVAGVTLYQKASGPGMTSAWSPELRICPPLEADQSEACSTAPAPEPPPGLARVRLLADQGEWESAAHCCRQILENDGLDPASHFYYALVLEQIGVLEDAERSLRRALYLDRRFTLAHYHLGLFLQKKNNVSQAARSFENVLELLSSRDQAETLADADGLTVADLKELARMHLEVLYRNERAEKSD